MEDRDETVLETALRRRAVNAERRVAELEKLVSELRRDALLPCKLCRDAGREAARKGQEEQWELLADTLLLVEPIWERSKETRVERIRPRAENLNLDPVALVQKSTSLIADLKDQLDRCERLKAAASESGTSLFSLFPFSSGAFERASSDEAVRRDRLRQRVSDPVPINDDSSDPFSSLASALDVSSWHLPNLQFWDSTNSSVLVATREPKLAAGAASKLLMEMAETLLELRLEVNSYIEELVRQTEARNLALARQQSELYNSYSNGGTNLSLSHKHTSVEANTEKVQHHDGRFGSAGSFTNTHVRGTTLVQPSHGPIIKELPNQHDSSTTAVQPSVVDDFFNESEIEADAAEVEL
mmetsp:Transcript_8659/g.17158  ORF Transcript_8659/g.17158 Transcript_8659/m.17158 type:complete len:356 (-) Transcript_8659:1019-2086(-)